MQRILASQTRISLTWRTHVAVIRRMARLLQRQMQVGYCTAMPSALVRTQWRNRPGADVYIGPPPRAVARSQRHSGAKPSFTT